MAGGIVHPGDVQLFASADGSESFRSTLNRQLLPVEGVSGGWYDPNAGATNPADVHEVDEIYFITERSAKVFLGGEECRPVAGDTVPVPRGCEHRFVNEGAERLALVYLFAPPPAPRTDPSAPSRYAPVAG